MSDLDRVGRRARRAEELLDAGLLHGDVMTVTGRTMAENLAEIDPPPPTVWSCIRSTRRSTRRAASSSSPARWRRRAQSSRSPVCRCSRCTSRAPARVFDGEAAAMEAILAGLDPARHRDRDPLRRPEGRPGHARDARHHRSAEGRRPRCRCRADHRRPLLGWYVGILHRARRARGGRRRPDRVRARRRPHPRRCPVEVARPAHRHGPNSPIAWMDGPRIPLATPPGCSASTPSSCRVPRPAPSPTPSDSFIRGQAPDVTLIVPSDVCRESGAGSPVRAVTTIAPVAPNTVY